MDVNRIKDRIPRGVRPVARHLYRTANRVFARSPEFVIIGTGRCGTGYTSAYLTRIGIPCAHEGYFTPSGPLFRNPERLFTARGDASWLAVPFAGDMDLKIAHQVRHPFPVIKSLYAIGFFDPAFYWKHKAFIDFAYRYFEPGTDPLDTCVRWYLEWNKRCEELTDFRYRVEDFEAALPALLDHIGEGKAARKAELSNKTNSRPSMYGDLADDEFRTALYRHPAMAQLTDMAGRYGYSLPTEAQSPAAGERQDA